MNWTLLQHGDNNYFHIQPGIEHTKMPHLRRTR